jgi:hypothetical protein
MTALSQDALYIIKTPGHGWKDRLWVETIDPSNGAVVGPLDLTGKTVTGTFTVTADGSMIPVAAGTGITIVNAAGGEFTAGLTSAQLSPVVVDRQVILRFTVWDGDLVLVNTSLTYTVKAG